jgi:hypothetical protein
VADCHVYVLGPRLQDGNKQPKWAPRSRRVQYLGASPLHASTVGLVRDQQTGNMSTQFHWIFDDHFETVHLDEGQELAREPALGEPPVIAQPLREQPVKE